MSARRLGFSVALSFSLVLAPQAAHAIAGTSYTWVGNSQGSGGDNHSWSDSANWQPVGVPGDGDSVVIEQPSMDDCFAHVDGVPTVELADFTMIETSALCTMSVTGGAISVSGLFSWNGGQLDTPTTIETDAMAHVNGSDQRLNRLTQDLDVAGTLTLTGVTGNGALQILHGHVLTVQAGASLISSGGPNEINGDECCTNPAKLVNKGTISVAGHTLKLATLELAQKASVVTSQQGKLRTSAGPVTAGAAGDYSGDGTWLITDGSNAQFNGTQTLGHHFHLEFGGLTSTSSSNSLAGTTTLAGTGTFDWTGGIIAAQLTIAHGVSVQVVGAHVGGGRRVLEGGGASAPVTQTNHGAMTIADGATISTAQQARLVNASDGVIGFEPGTGLASEGCCTAPDRLTNDGTVRVLSTGGSGPAVLTGVTYRSAGTTAIAGGRTLQLTGGAPDKLTAGKVTGGGHLLIASPTAVSGTVTVAAHTRLQLDTHGTLDGTATLAGAGDLRWTGGSMSGAVTVSTGGGVAIAGSDVKTIANIGGGSTASTVKLTVPTTVAAGTSAAHDVINVGSSALTLESPTVVGAFTDFDNGTVDNRSTFSVHSGQVSARTYEQSSHAKLALVAGKTERGLLTSIGTVSLHGTLTVHNTYTPHVGDKVTVVKAPTLTDSLSCVGTTGTATSGSHAGHWADAHTTTKVVLVWRHGASAAC